MISIILGLLFQLFPFPGPGRAPAAGGGGSNNIAFESSGTKVCSSGSEVSTLDCTSNTFTTGWTVFVWCSGYNIQTVSSASDGTNTYDPVHASLSDGGNARGRMFRANNVTGGTYTVTCTYSGAVFPSMSVVSYSGVATASSNDGVTTGTGSSTAPTPSSGLTTTNANNILFTCTTTALGSAQTFTAPTSPDYTKRTEYTNGAITSTHSCADRIVTATDTFTPAWTLGTTSGWVVGLTAEKSQ